VRLKQFQAKSGADPRFWSACDEELDEGDLVDVAGKDGEERGCRFFVLTLVQGVDNDQGSSLHRLERLDDELLHLRTQGLPSDIRTCPQDRKQLLSKTRIPVGELEGESGEDGSEVAPVVEVSRTEEARPELPVGKAHLRKCLGDGGLAGPGEAVEPEYALVLLIVQPGFELGEDIPPGPFHASLSVSAEVAGVWGMIHPLEKVEARPFLFSG